MLTLLPTDTCYWLAWSFSKEDYEAIYDAKGRLNTKQLAFLVEYYDVMSKYVEISLEQIEFLKKYPHPWSFLGVRNPDFILPEWMDASKYEKISIRVAKVCIPNYELQMKHCKYPLFLTSANLSGQPESKTLEEAQNIFPWIEGIDGWVCDRAPSDIFSLDENGEITYLRRNYWLN